MSETSNDTKTIANLVRSLMKSNNVSVDEVSQYLQCTPQSFRNKLSRDSFSIYDLIIITEVCNANIAVKFPDSADMSDEDKLQMLTYEDYLPLDKKDHIKTLHANKLKKQLTDFTNSISNLPVEKQRELLKKQFPGIIK